MSETAAYRAASAEREFVKRGAYYVESADGYRIAKANLGSSGAYYATKSGETLCCERYSNEAQQRDALAACKRACELHSEGEK